MMRNGVAPFNGALYSTVATSLFPVFFKTDVEGERTAVLWIAVAVGGLIRLEIQNHTTTNTQLKDDNDVAIVIGNYFAA